MRNMKPCIWAPVVYLSIFFLLFGCAAYTPPKPSFDQDHLPNSQPYQDSEPVPTSVWVLSEELTTCLNDKRLHSFTWFSEDNIILTITDVGSFLIIPSSGETRKLMGAESELFTRKIREKIQLEITETKAGGFFKTLMTIGGSDRNYPYRGLVQDNGYTLDMSLNIHEDWEKPKSSGGGFLAALASSARCVGASAVCAVNNQASGETFKLTLPWSCHITRKEQVEERLSCLRVSDDGRKYLYGITLYDINSKTKNGFLTGERLISSYRIVDATFSPSWGQVALLRASKYEKGEGQGKNKYEYLIEYYNFVP